MSDMRALWRSRAKWALILVTLAACSAAPWIYHSIPGTLVFDSKTGFRGTGTHTSRYPDGSVSLAEDFRRGKLLRSVWFKPDGSVVAATDWKDGAGVGYYLRNDGTIKIRMTYANGIAHGPVTYFNPDGSIAGEAEFRDGQRISGYKPSKEEPR